MTSDATKAATKAAINAAFAVVDELVTGTQVSLTTSYHYVQQVVELHGARCFGVFWAIWARMAHTVLDRREGVESTLRRLDADRAAVVHVLAIVDLARDKRIAQVGSYLGTILDDDPDQVWNVTGTLAACAAYAKVIDSPPVHNRNTR